MKAHSGIDKKFNSILGYIYVILCLFCTAVMYNLILPYHLNSSITRVILAFVCLIGVLSSKRISIKTIVFVLFYSIYLFIYIVLTRYNVNEYILSFFVPFISISVYCIETVREGKERYIINAFINVMTVISVVSLFFWVFGTILDIIPPTMILPYMRGHNLLETRTYYFVFFMNKVQKIGLFGLDTIRNVGIFAEAPSFASPLLYAIGAELLYNRNNMNRVKLGILTAAIISTLSSKGFVGLILVMIIRYLFFYKAENKYQSIIKILISFFVLVCGIYLINIIIVEKSDSATGIDRIQDLQAALRAFSTSPILGVGFNNFDVVHGFGSSSLKGMSMGITTLMAYGGIYLLIPYLIPFLVLVFKSRNFVHRKEILCFAMIVIFDFFISIMHSNPCLFTVVGLAYGIILKNTRITPLGSSYKRNRDYS